MTGFSSQLVNSLIFKGYLFNCRIYAKLHSGFPLLPMVKITRVGKMKGRFQEPPLSNTHIHQSDCALSGEMLKSFTFACKNSNQPSAKAVRTKARA